MKKELKDTAFVGGLLIDGTGAEPIMIPGSGKDGKSLYVVCWKRIWYEYEIVDVLEDNMPGLIDTICISLRKLNG